MKSADKWSASGNGGPALARLSAFVAVVLALVSLPLLSQVGAQVDEAMLALGSRVMSFPGEPVAEARTININGASFFLRTQVVEAPLSQAIRHYRSVCTSAHAGSSSHASIMASLATRTGESDSDGYVACIDMGASDLETLVRRMARFSKTWDLAALGSLRYAYLRRAAERPARETFVLTMWTDESVDLARLLPTGDDDAGGSDLTGVPRPPESQRILSAKELREPAGVFVYLVRRTTASELERDYRRQLAELGWAIVERSHGESVELNGVRVLSAEKGHRLVTLLFYPDGTAQTVTTILASGVE